MNHRLKGRRLIHGDIIDPEITIAEFSEDFSSVECEKLVATLNHGHDMILAYATYRQRKELHDVVNLVSQLEESYRHWTQAVFDARVKGEQE